MLDTDYHQQGYDKGYEHGLAGDNRIDDPLLVDMFIPVAEDEQEWREGYAAGYEAGEEERRANEEE